MTKKKSQSFLPAEDESKNRSPSSPRLRTQYRTLRERLKAESSERRDETKLESRIRMDLRMYNRRLRQEEKTFRDFIQSYETMLRELLREYYGIHISGDMTEIDHLVLMSLIKHYMPMNK